ncbi:MAG: amidase [Gammaproteobacteria bacterium]
MLEHSITELAACLRDGRLSCQALYEELIDRERRYGALLNAYKTWDEGLIRRQAEAAAAVFESGGDLGVLQGLPVSVKDLFGVRGYPIFAGSPRRLPASWEREGPVVRRLKHGLPVISGKTHTVEFAVGGLGTNAHYGAPRNPWDARAHRVSGGSSSGAGVSLLEGTAVLALGSDTSGSVRMPASMTGTVGFMPSLGRWSTEGIVPVSETLDAPGLLARTVADLVQGFTAIDIASDESGWRAEGSGLSGVTPGLVETPFWQDCAPGIAEGAKRALDDLVQHGARVVACAIPEARDAFELFRIGHLSAPEACTNLKTHFADWIDTIDPNVWSRLRGYGEAMPAAEYLARRRRIFAWMDSVNERLRTVDAIVTPTVAITPPTLAQIATPDDYRTLNMAASRNAAILALFDLCAISIPVALDAEGMPVGLQIACRRGEDQRLLALALACENVLGTARQRLGRPPLCVDG